MTHLLDFGLFPADCRVAAMSISRRIGESSLLPYLTVYAPDADSSTTTGHYALPCLHYHYITSRRLIPRASYLLCDDVCFRRILFDPAVLINSPSPTPPPPSLSLSPSLRLSVSRSLNSFAQPLLPTAAYSHPPFSLTYVHKRASERARACTRIQVYLGRIRYYGNAKHPRRRQGDRIGH